MPQARFVEINNGIKARFFEAIRSLLQIGALHGRQTYCREAGIDKRNFYAQEADISVLRIQLYWLVPLIEDYGVNAKWLLTGQGEMYEITPQPRRRTRRRKGTPAEA